MKHLATGVVILLLCLAICFTSLAVLDRWTTHATSQLEQALELADQEYFDEAEALVTETWEFWRRRRGFFGMVLRHTEADQVNSTFRQCQSVSCASGMRTRSSRIPSISRNIFGASTKVSVISRLREYHRAARAPSVNKQFFTTKPSTCQKGYFPSNRHPTASMFVHSFNADSPAWMITFSKYKS